MKLAFFCSLKYRLSDSLLGGLNEGGIIKLQLKPRRQVEGKCAESAQGNVV